MKDSEFKAKLQELVGSIVDDSSLISAPALPPSVRDLISFIILHEDDTEPDTGSTGSHRDFNVGESDYASRKIQPWDTWINWAPNPWDADILKRIVRTKRVPGLTPLEARIQDYTKIQHICDERLDHLRKGDPYYQNFSMPPWVDKP